MIETVNAVEAWLGSLPGHVYANVRQPPISTLNLAHMIPLSAVWAGEARDHHFKAPPLFLAKTEGSTPFRFSLHVGDVGHTLVVGPTGAGKSVLLALMALQFRRYPELPDLRLRFRRIRSAPPQSPWVAIGMTSAARSSGESTEFVDLQPLAAIDDVVRARLGGGLDQLDPRPREDRSHAGSQGASLVGVDFAGLRSDSRSGP